MLSAIVVARFWSKVNKTDGCWLWTAGTCRGYGAFHIGPGPRVGAHRVAWALTNGPIPDNLSVLHRCDVRACVNPNHLFLGTQDDNLKDAATKGRFTVPRARKLTQADRLAIYRAPRDKGRGKALAQSYGVSEACIAQIRKGRFLGSGVWPGTKQQDAR